MANKWTFRTLWGGQIESQTIEKGKTATKPNDPQKDGYLFIEWQTSDGKPFNFNTAIVSNITLKAAYYKLATVSSEEELQQAFNTEGIEYIILSQDIDIISPINVNRNNKFILDMNGKTISNNNDICDDTDGIDKWSLISVQGKADLTITGEGCFKAKENDCFAIDIRNGSTLTIENGEYIGNISAIYVSEGKLFIKDGDFSIQQLDNNKPYEFILNCYDPNYQRKDLGNREYTGPANIEVSGGTFHNFNPGNCQAEGEKTDFLKAGYKSVEAETGIYTVVPLTQEGSLTDYIDILNIIGCATNKVMTTESYASNPSLTFGTINNNTEAFIFFNETEVVLQPTELLNWDVDTNSQVTVILDGKISLRHTIDTDNTFGVIDFRRNTSIDGVLHKIYASGNNTADHCIIDDVIINDIEKYNPPIINQ